MFGIEFIKQLSKLLSLQHFISVFIYFFELYRSVFDEYGDCPFEKADFLYDELDVHLLRQLLSIIYNLLVFAKAPKISLQKTENVDIKCFFLFYGWRGLIWTSFIDILSRIFWLVFLLVHVMACLNFKGERAVLTAYDLKYGKEGGGQTSNIGQNIN